MYIHLGYLYNIRYRLCIIIGYLYNVVEGHAEIELNLREALRRRHDQEEDVDLVLLITLLFEIT